MSLRTSTVAKDPECEKFMSEADNYSGFFGVSCGSGGIGGLFNTGYASDECFAARKKAAENMRQCYKNKQITNQDSTLTNQVIIGFIVLMLIAAAWYFLYKKVK